MVSARATAAVHGRGVTDDQVLKSYPASPDRRLLRSPFHSIPQNLGKIERFFLTWKIVRIHSHGENDGAARTLAAPRGS
jgi:hypothetical protein